MSQIDELKLKNNMLLNDKENLEIRNKFLKERLEHNDIIPTSHV